MVEINDRSRTRTKEGKDEKGDTCESVHGLYEGRELTLNAFKSGIFPIKSTQGKRQLKILTPKQMFQRFSIAHAQVKADNKPENVLNEIRQLIYFLYQAKEIIKK